jgi:tRNA(adenine34) deaminase
MYHAISLAKQAQNQGEVPVGALLVKNHQLIAEAWNTSIAHDDATAHAEINVIRKAGKIVNNYRLMETTLYVTLEPCVMCMGAISHSRIQRLVFGAYDLKRGAVCHALHLADAPFLNHSVNWTGGVLITETAHLLSHFFKTKRQIKTLIK